jgi:heme/copper-type cytochrome/quinol oxidase subunit 4
LAKIFDLLSFLKNKWWHTGLCAIFILILSLIPVELLIKPYFSYEDLLVHFLMYGGLAVCLALSVFDHLKAASLREIVLGILLLALFGFSVEVLQNILPVNRFFSIADAIANTIGASSFYLIARAVKNS